MSDEYVVKKSDLKKLKKGLFGEILEKKGYKFNKVLMACMFGVMITLFLIVLKVEGASDKWYVRCPEDGRSCQNPFYECTSFTGEWCPSVEMKLKVCGDDPLFCVTPLLNEGSVWGHPPGWLYSHFFELIMLDCLFFYALNHVLYNKKKQRERRVKQW